MTEKFQNLIPLDIHVNSATLAWNTDLSNYRNTKLKDHNFVDRQVVERRKQIEIETQEIVRKEKELISTIKLPAEAEAYKVQAIAEGNRYESQTATL